MQFRLDLELSNAEGALVRVIGMVERRGFTALAIQGARVDSSGHWQLSLTVEGQRPAATLGHQLEKIYDCQRVQITAVAPQVAA